MIEIPRAQGALLAPFFAYTPVTLILSYTQGHMGRGWVDRLPDPTCARVITGDYCALAGDHRSDGAAKLARDMPEGTKMLLIAPQNEHWSALIEAAHPQYDKYLRYAIKKEPDCFDKARLQAFIDALPAELRLKRIDAELYDLCLTKQNYMRDFVSQFDSATDYLARGIGYCVLDGETIVSGASSYTVYDGGIEIEIQTEKAYRRRGLALCCAAQLILQCLAEGRYPSWDAANLKSVALAEKLGYHLDYAYDTYEIDFTKETS